MRKLLSKIDQVTEPVFDVMDKPAFTAKGHEVRYGHLVAAAGFIGGATVQAVAMFHPAIRESIVDTIEPVVAPVLQSAIEPMSDFLIDVDPNSLVEWQQLSNHDHIAVNELPTLPAGFIRD